MTKLISKPVAVALLVAYFTCLAICAAALIGALGGCANRKDDTSIQYANKLKNFLTLAG